MRTRQELEQALEESERRFAQIIEDSPHAVVIHGDGRVLYANRAAVRLLRGTSAEQFLGRHVLEFVHPSSHEKVIERARRIVEEHTAVEAAEERLLCVDGDVIDVESVAGPADFGGRPAVHVILWDITARKQVEARLAHDATHDPLTGLANRTVLRDRIEQALARLERTPAHLALMLVDLDDFKGVNDRYGHHVGDAVLVAVAQRMQEIVRPADTLARLGGDEFVIVCDDLAQPSDANEIAGRVLEASRQPVAVKGDVVRVSASIGVVLTTQADEDLDTLLRRADAAMYRAKRKRRGFVTVRPERGPDRRAARVAAPSSTAAAPPDEPT